jgi:hypothetical protein
VTFDSAASPVTRMYKGTLSSAVAELTGFSTTLPGTGAVESDAAAALWVGNWEALNLAFEGRIERVGLVNRVLDATELETIRPYALKTCNVSGTVLLASYRNGDVTDYSGNGNTGTITGATNSDGPWTSAMATLQAGQRHLNQILGR